MLKEVVASKAAKLIAACVCPVAGTTALTVSVPEVRQAVHRATAPRAYAKPKTRVRQAPAVATAVAACPTPADTPVVLASAPLATPVLPVTSILPLPSEQIAALAPGFAGGGGGFVFTEGPFAFPGPGGGGFFPPPGPGPGGEAPPIPEPRVWLQLLIGFGVIGGAARGAYRHQRKAAGEDA